MSYLEINDAQIFYEVSGDGPAIVFVHGWSMDHSYWKPQVEFFSKAHRTVVYDLRGMGNSSGGEPAYKFTRLIEDLAALLSMLDIHRPVICGHSLGGSLAVQYAISYPEAISAIAVVDAPGPRSITNSRLSYGLLSAATKAAGLFARNSLRPFIWLFRNRFFSKAFAASHPTIMDAWKRQFLTNSRRSLLNAGFALAYREDPLSNLNQIKVPTLILRGSVDRVVTEREARAHHDGIRGSRLHQIEGAGHSSMMEQPEIFNQLLQQFLADSRNNHEGIH